MALLQAGLFTQAFAHRHSINQLTYSEHLLCAWQPGPVLGDGARALSDTVQMQGVALEQGEREGQGGPSIAEVRSEC